MTDVSAMVERAAVAYSAEIKEWGLRVNKGEPEPHEIIRHTDPEVVSPVVVESYANYPRAEQRFEELRAEAGARAALLAALDGNDVEQTIKDAVRQAPLTQAWQDADDPQMRAFVTALVVKNALKAAAQGGNET